MSVEHEKKGWVEKHAQRLEFRFEQWQKPLGIDSDEYLRYLTEELETYYDDPLHRSLIESIS